MATTHPTTTDLRHDVVEQLAELLERDYRADLGELAQRYPGDQQHLTIDWSDLYRYSPAIADDYLQQPELMDAHLQAAIPEIDLPFGVALDDVEIRMVGLGDAECYQPLDALREAPDGYLGITGELSKVSTPTRLLEYGVFECLRCGVTTGKEQHVGGREPPAECQGCDRSGPFELLDKHENTVFEHYCKVRIETPPDETGDLQQEYMDGFVRGDLVWAGHDEYGLVARSGEAVTAYGTLEYRARGTKGEESRQYDPYLDLQAIEFSGDQQEVDIEAYRDEFEALATREDAVDVFAESIAPELYATPEWDAALELLVAYLFGAPRIDIQDGPTYRGDIHALIVSDYGMGKSMVNSAVALFSPKCIKESVTGMSSDVALLAAAVEDDFGGGGWTLEPGILVRANGGHVILDEIDKTDVNLERMNNALEGEQVVDINKAGQSATYKSRVGLLATGNPQDSRFNRHEPISEQLDIDQSLLSRFDGIVTMADEPDTEQDAKVAETQGESYIEAFEYQFGDREELDTLERTVDVDVGRNWVACARQECHPIPQLEQVHRIRDWYSEEVRQLNEQFSSGEAADMPAPASARVVPATIRFAVAFARVHLRDEVADADVERAMQLSKTLVGQNFDGEQFVPQESRRSPQTQQERAEALQSVLVEADDALTVEELAEETGIDEGKVEHRIEEWSRKGEVYEPQVGGGYRWS